MNVSIEYSKQVKSQAGGAFDVPWTPSFLFPIDENSEKAILIFQCSNRDPEVFKKEALEVAQRK